MEIKSGNYIIKSDNQCYWIEEKYIGKTKAGKEKEYTRQVSGYYSNFRDLMKNFIERKTRSSEAEDLKTLLLDIGKAQNDAIMMIEAAMKPKK